MSSKNLWAALGGSSLKSRLNSQGFLNYKESKLFSKVRTDGEDGKVVNVLRKGTRETPICDQIKG